MQYAPLLGRILFSIAFLMFGFNHFTNAGMMAEQMVPAFLPAKLAVVYLTGVLLIVCGIAVILGFRAKLAGLVLFFFLLSTAFLVWGSGFFGGDMTATTMFLKDLSMAGGALLIAYFGAGPYSMDDRAAAASDEG